jgi:hypothetical protein
VDCTCLIVVLITDGGTWTPCSCTLTSWYYTVPCTKESRYTLPGRLGTIHNLVAYSRDEAAQALVRGSCWFPIQTTRRMRKSGKVGRSLFHLRRCFQLAPRILFPLACALAPAPLPIGNADDSVAQQLQIPSLQQGGTRWRPARKEVPRPVKLHCPRPPADVVSMSM